MHYLKRAFHTSALLLTGVLFLNPFTGNIALADLCDISGCRCFGSCPDGQTSSGVFHTQPQTYTPPPNQAASLCATADDLLRTGHLVEAQQGYEQAIAANPRFAAAYYGLGRILELQSRFFEAQMRYTQAGDLGMTEGYRAYARIAQLAAARKATPAPLQPALPSSIPTLPAQADHNAAIELAKAKVRIDHLLGNLAQDMESPARTGQDNLPKWEGGANSSSTLVDLRFLDPDQPMVVDPRVVKGKMTPAEAEADRARTTRAHAAISLALQMLDKGDLKRAKDYLLLARDTLPQNSDIQQTLSTVMHIYDQRLHGPAHNPRVEALLDALEYGHEDLQAGIDYLLVRMRESPPDFGPRDAYYYLLGNIHGFGPQTQMPDPRPSGNYDPKTLAEIDQAITLAREGSYFKAVDALHRLSDLHPDDTILRDLKNYTEGNFPTDGN